MALFGKGIREVTTATYPCSLNLSNPLLPSITYTYSRWGAALRRQSEIAIGNIIGSNIFNALGILGVTALIAPIPLAKRFLSFDLPVMIAVSAMLTALLLLRPSIGRLAGVGQLMAYAVYLWAALA